MQRPGSESWLGKTDGVPRTPRFAKPVIQDGIKTARNNSLAAIEPIFKKGPRNASEILPKTIP